MSSLEDRAPYIVSYDIRCPRRLGRIHRRLKGQGMRGQYSVFFLWLSVAELVDLELALDEEIAPEEDDIRIYPLPRRPDGEWLGLSPFPDGVHLPDPFWQEIRFPGNLGEPDDEVDAS